MRNITITLDDRTADLSREYAQQRGTSLSALVKELLTKLVNPETRHEERIDEFFSEMDRAGGKSQSGKKFRREELYRY